MPAENTVKTNKPALRRHYRGRIGQVRIYLGKLLRMFLYQNDWKLLPMAALVAGLVGIVIRKRLFINMEGTLISALAIACVCLWNGCFNSIQVICRERDIIKREHRSGMHISSYIAAHMIYQALLCLLQTGITIYVLSLTGVQFPDHSLITRSFFSEFFISLFLITYAADMMSLFISALCHTTTAAMTVMPVVLIIQLVFSGGLMNLPARLEPVSNYTITNVGLKLIACEADYNHLELSSGWNTMVQMKDTAIRGSFTIGQLVDGLQNAENPTIQKLRAIEVLRGNSFPDGLTVGDIADQLGEDNPDARELRKEEIPYETTIGDILGIVGEQSVRDYIVLNTSQAAQKPEYDYVRLNLAEYWLELLLFAGFFALCATVALEFIDKDKR